MALINGMYLPVLEEKVTREIETVAHPVEQGIDITDHVKKRPTEISLAGEILGENAGDILSQLAEMNKSGVVITYAGRNYFKNGQIIDFSTSHTHAIWGGCSFDMTIREVRFAGSAYNPSAASPPDGSPLSAAQQAATSHRPTTGISSAGLQQRERHSDSPQIIHHSKNGDTIRSISTAYHKDYTKIDAQIKENSALNKERSRNFIPAGSQIPVSSRFGNGNY